MEGLISIGNSTDTPLAGAGVFTGSEWDLVQHFANVTVVIHSDAASAVDGVEFLWSTNGVDENVTDDRYTYNITDPLFNPTDGQVFTSPVLAKYFKIRYTNDVGAQSFFQLQAIYRYAPATLRYRRLKDFMNPEDQGLVVKAQAFAQDPLTGISYPQQTSDLLNPVVAVAESIPIGELTAPAASDDDGTHSLISLFKRLLQKITAQFPAALTGSGHFKVAIQEGPVAVSDGAGSLTVDGTVAATIANGDDACEGTTTDAAVTSDSNGTISGKIRGLVKILADVWDSTNHRLKVLVSSIVGANATLGGGGMDVTFLANLPYLYDRQSDLWRRQWGNCDVLLLSSGSRTTTQVLSGSDQFLPVGVHRLGLIVNVSVVGTGTLTPSIEILEPINGTYQTLWTAATAITGTGYFMYLFADGALTGGTWKEVLPFTIPGRAWQLTLTKSDGSNWTFGAGARYG